MQITTTQASASPFALAMGRDAIRAAIGRAARYDEEVEATTTIEEDYVEDSQPTLHGAEDYLVEDSELNDEIDFACFDEEDHNY
jgi:hypothetical protein